MSERHEIIPSLPAGEVMHAPSSLPVTVTIRRDDLESAINDIYYAHNDYCVSPRGALKCSCTATAERLRAALDAAT